MKKTNQFLGVISIVVLSVGVIFKKCHWPGANVLLSVGALALAAFFVAYLFIGIKPLTTAIEKSVGVSGGIAMCLNLVAFMFKVQHWAGASILINISLLGLLVTSVLLIIGSVNETDQAKLSIKTLFAFTLGTITVILIMLTKLF